MSMLGRAIRAAAKKIDKAVTPKGRPVKEEPIKQSLLDSDKNPIIEHTAAAKNLAAKRGEVERVAAGLKGRKEGAVAGAVITSGIIAAAYGGKKAYDELTEKQQDSFSTAFKKARKGDERNFKWKGGTYSTKLDVEATPVPKKKPIRKRSKPVEVAKKAYGGMTKKKNKMKHTDYRKGGLFK